MTSVLNITPVTLEDAAGRDFDWRNYVIPWQVQVDSILHFPFIDLHWASLEIVSLINCCTHFITLASPAAQMIIFIPLEIGVLCQFHHWMATIMTSVLNITPVTLEDAAGRDFDWRNYVIPWRVQVDSKLHFPFNDFHWASLEIVSLINCCTHWCYWHWFRLPVAQWLVLQWWGFEVLGSRWWITSDQESKQDQTR